MYDQEEKPDNLSQENIDLEEKPKNPEQELAVLKQDLDILRKRVVSLEDEMRRVKEQLRKMSFTPGL